MKCILVFSVLGTMLTSVAAFPFEGLPSETQRTTLLAEVEAKKREALPALEEESRQLEAAMERLRKEEAALRKNPRFGDLFNKEVTSQFNSLMKNQRALTIKIQKAQDGLDRKVSDFEQERRKIVLKYPESSDPKLTEYKGLLRTPDELNRQKAYEKEHADHKTVADAYMKSLVAKKTVGSPKFSGFFKNPKGEDSFAAAYKVSSVNGNKVLGDTVHMYVFKDKQGYWQISAFSQDGVHVRFGPPPKEFQQVPTPNGLSQAK